MCLCCASVWPLFTLLVVEVSKSGVLQVSDSYISDALPTLSNCSAAAAESARGTRLGVFLSLICIALVQVWRCDKCGVFGWDYHCQFCRTHAPSWFRVVNPMSPSQRAFNVGEAKADEKTPAAPEPSRPAPPSGFLARATLALQQHSDLEAKFVSIAKVLFGYQSHLSLFQVMAWTERGEDQLLKFAVLLDVSLLLSAAQAQCCCLLGARSREVARFGADSCACKAAAVE